VKRNIVIGIPLTVLVVALALSLATSVIGSASAAGPALQTPTTGQPGASNGVSCGSGTATQTPGGSGSSPGAPFNGALPGQADTVYAGNPGTDSLEHSNSTAAVSQYDVACLQVTGHHP
jgi:hypothetical protein